MSHQRHRGEERVKRVVRWLVRFVRCSGVSTVTAVRNRALKMPLERILSEENLAVRHLRAENVRQQCADKSGAQ